MSDEPGKLITAAFPRTRQRGAYDDPGFLERLQTRDRKAQEQLYLTEKGRCMAIAVSILRSTDHAESLVSDLFTDFFFTYVDRVREGRAIPAYLRIMCQRRARGQRTRMQRQVELEPDRVNYDPTDDTEEQLERKLYSRWLERCVGQLNPQAREVLKLHFGHEMSYSEIGDQQGKSKQAVGKGVLKSLALLRECLERKRTARGEER